MKRRTFILSSASFTGLSLLSGCIGSLTGNQVQDSDGDGMVDSKDYAPNDPDVQEKSDVDTSDSGTSTSTSSVPDKSEREEILRSYNEGIDGVNDGTRTLDSAISSFNDDQLSESISLSEEAISKFEDAESRFSSAVNTALRIGHSEAVSISQDAQEYALHMQLAAQYSSMAADAAQKGNTEQANGFVEKHRSEYQQARELGVRDPPVLKDVLGL